MEGRNEKAARSSAADIDTGRAVGGGEGEAGEMADGAAAATERDDEGGDDERFMLGTARRVSNGHHGGHAQ